MQKLTDRPFILKYIVLLLFCFKGSSVLYAQEEGLASFYHHRFHGKKSASGRVHDLDEHVAAHRTYPFGTFLRVTNLKNMRTTIVCVTDRGPFRKGRIIDVSAVVAEELGFKKHGITQVRVEEVPGKTDLRWLDLLDPRIPCLKTDHLLPDPPYRIKIKK